MPCASLPRHEGDGGKEIPAKTLILFFKNKKKTQNRQNFLKTASYLIISQKLAWKRHLLCPCSRTCSGLCPSPPPPAPGHRRCQPIVPRGSAPHPGRPQWRVPVGTPRPLFASVVAPQVPGRAAGGSGQPRWVHNPPPAHSCGYWRPPKRLSSPAWHRDKVLGTGGLQKVQQRGCTAFLPPASPARHSPPGTHRLRGSAPRLRPSRSRMPVVPALMS